MAEPAPEQKGFPSPERWAVPVLLAWLVPGGGHFYLRRWNLGGVLLFAIGSMFVFGLLMRGRMFEPATGDLFTTVVNWGGYIGDLASGSLYFLATWLGYAQERLPNAVADYGTKFLVCAGLLNILAMVDAYEIATGEKS